MPFDRVYEAPAYGPPGACFWADGVAPIPWPRLEGHIATEVAIIGGGLTGLSAALHLGQAGVPVVILEAGAIGHGASGRNGGFCCLGGGMAPPALLERRFGAGAAQDWAETEKAAVAHVRDLIGRFGWQVDMHSQGETMLAHSPRAFRAMQAEAPALADRYGVVPDVIPREALARAGFGGRFFGAMTVPLGFALNPRKYLAGLADAVTAAGGWGYADSPVTGLTPGGTGWRLETPGGIVTARRVILATNGYSSDNLPDWLRARYLPVQSSVIVTRPLAMSEWEAQGWTTDQMAYDSRVLLHYFRRLPEGRFLFGMRGGLRATPRAQAAISRRIRRDFHAMFPAWRGVEITHDWSGLVCLMPNIVPFVGPVPGADGLFAALGYHGNGVAMGSYAGACLAALVRGRRPDGPLPPWLGSVPRRFPLGRHRRLLLRPAYLAAGLFDL